MNMRGRWMGVVGVILAAGFLARADSIAVSNGQTIVFLGDSITRDGMAESGWARLVVSGLGTNGIVVKPIGSGAGGNTSWHMLDRLDQSVIKNPYLAGRIPEWMTLSCGVNDVNFGPEKSVVDLDSFASNVTAIVDRCQAAGIRVMVLTPTMIGEDPATRQNRRMEPYLEVVRTLAREKRCLLADPNAAMRAALAGENPARSVALPSGLTSGVFLRDGVHMNPAGDVLMAKAVLAALGLTPDQIDKAESAWFAADAPATVRVPADLPLSLAQYRALDEAAARRGTTAQKLVEQELEKAVRKLIEKAP